MLRSWTRFVGAGFELAGITGVVGLVGYGIDRFCGNGTLVATAIAVLVGFSFAMFRFITLAVAADRAQ